MNNDLEYMALHHLTETDTHLPTDPSRIRLRSMSLEWDEPAHGARTTTVQGIALPDGRFIFGGNQTYSSERVMLALNPGAKLQWWPDADEVMNYIMPEDKIP